MKIGHALLGVLMGLLLLSSCKDEPESYTYTISGTISVLDSCGPSRDAIIRDTLSSEVKLSFAVRHPDSTRLNGSTVVYLDSMGSARYQVQVTSSHKLVGVGSWGIPQVEIKCPSFRCFADSIPNCQATPTRGTTLRPVLMSSDSVIQNLRYACYCL